MKTLTFLVGILFVSTIQAETLCFQWHNVNLTLNKEQATIVPVETVSLVGALTAKRYAKPVVGAAVLRKDGSTPYWNMILDNNTSVPQMTLDTEWNPIMPNDWIKVPCN